MKPEQRFWSKWLRDRMPKGHATRIESEVEPGFPDVHFTNIDGSHTLELKVAKQKRIPLKKALRPSQKFWIREEVAANGSVWIVARVDREVLFIRGSFVDQLDTMNLAALKEAADCILPINAKISECKREIRRTLRVPF